MAFKASTFKDNINFNDLFSEVNTASAIVFKNKTLHTYLE